MPPLTDVGEKLLLDWVLGGATPTRPATRWISFATASPNITSAFDGPIQSRMTVTFASANSPQMSVTNLNAVSNITATAACTVVGWSLWNSSSGGTRLAYGTATAAIGCKANDNIAIGAGAIKITLA
jgi:hypothetical protein